MGAVAVASINEPEDAPMRHATIPSLVATAVACFAVQAQAADQMRSVAPFTAISNSGPLSLRIEVGKTQSVTVGGDEDLVPELETEVVDNELRLHLRHEMHHFDGHHGGLHVTVTLPQLTAFTMNGAGNTTITNMSGDHLDINFVGAGGLKAEGTVKTLKLDVSGAASIDTRALHADTADINLAGVGSVKVWAGQSLDASVGGVGSLRYYGDPKTVNTHGGGLGSVSKGK